MVTVLSSDGRALVCFAVAIDANDVARTPPCMNYASSKGSQWVEAPLPGGNLFEGKSARIKTPKQTFIWRLGGSYLAQNGREL